VKDLHDDPAPLVDVGEEVVRRITSYGAKKAKEAIRERKKTK
jgi:hypothetical protein